ncbi:MAG: PAS domain S-box protein [Chitinophagaceae bacterium]|nr:MAG: PAS domain S-box protein [Chitinophagaceae bacterium]
MPVGSKSPLILRRIHNCYMTNDSTIGNNDHPFLRGGGLTGELLRSMDFSSHPIGDPGQWPDALKISVSNLLACPFAMGIAWSDRLFHFYNDAFIPLMGWSKHPSALCSNVQDVYPESWHLLGPMFNRVMKGESMHFEDMLIPSERHGQMEDCWFDFSYSPIRDLDGRVRGILVITIETTQKLRYEQQLRSSSEELKTSNEELTDTVKQLDEAERSVRNIILQAPVAMCMLLGPDFKMEVANDMMVKLLGRPAAEIMGRPVFDAVPEVAGLGLEQSLYEVYQHGTTFRANEQKLELYRDGGKEVVYQNLVYEPYRHKDGSITGIIAIASDVTDQVLSKKILKETYEQLRIAVATAEMGTFKANLRTRLMSLSDRGSEIYGLPAGVEQKFENMMALVVPEYHQKLKEAGRAAIENMRPFEMDLEIQPPGCTDRKWIRATGMINHDKAGFPSHITGTLLDITERKLDELRKNDFIGMVSHELKTPLTSISAVLQMAQVKQEKPDEAFLQYAMQKASAQVKRMAKLINGFLNISRLESGKVHLDKTRFKMDDLIHEVIDELKFTSKGQEITLSTCSSIEVEADREKIGSVLNNLLTNAIKYANSPSPIELTCVSEDDRVTISVKDEGIGISETDQPRIFERYYRVDNQQMNKVTGFGIGLYLSAEIIHRHNGSIGVQSVPGKGSTFYFSLPLP